MCNVAANALALADNKANMSLSSNVTSVYRFIVQGCVLNTCEIVFVIVIMRCRPFDLYFVTKK